MKAATDKALAKLSHQEGAANIKQQQQQQQQLGDSPALSSSLLSEEATLLAAATAAAITASSVAEPLLASGQQGGQQATDSSTEQAAQGMQQGGQQGQETAGRTEPQGMTGVEQSPTPPFALAVSACLRANICKRRSQNETFCCVGTRGATKQSMLEYATKHEHLGNRTITSQWAMAIL